MQVTNPYTEVTSEIAEMSDVAGLYQRVNARWTEWRAASVAERVVRLRCAFDQCSARREELENLISDEMGKPIRWSRIELERVLDEWRYFLDNAESFLAPEVVAGSTIHFAPLGVVAVVSPWNFPLLLPLRGIIPALLAGNAVLFKPSELTPRTGLAVHSMIAPHAPLEVVVGGKEIGARVVELPVVAIAFTGSTAVGKVIAQQAAKRLARVSLELGGLDPAIVLADADIETAVLEIVKNNASNSGQVCNAIKRVLVHDSIFEPFLARARDVVASLKYGDPRDPSTEVGPLVSAAQRARVQGYLDDAIAQGAVAYRAPVSFNHGYFFPQTILTKVPNTAQLLHEEPFGPILPLIPFTTTEEAVRIANGTPYGLSASVWTRDMELAQALAMQLECGTVRINSHGGLRPGVPWGGCKESGIGRMKTKEGLREFTNIKAVA